MNGPGRLPGHTATAAWDVDPPGAAVAWRHPVGRGDSNDGGANAGAARAGLADAAFMDPHRQVPLAPADHELDVLPVGPGRIDDRSMRKVQRSQLRNGRYRDDYVRIRDLHRGASHVLQRTGRHALPQIGKSRSAHVDRDVPGAVEPHPPRTATGADDHLVCR